MGFVRSPKVTPGHNVAMRVIGIDLAWGEGSSRRPANETGLVAVERTGRVIAAGWAIGIIETAEWINRCASQDTMLMVDAPLVVSNVAGQRLCEKQVGQRYGRWKVSANSTNTRSARLAGKELLRLLALMGWRYHDGCGGTPPTSGRHVAEVYPYATLVGASALGYDMERPAYKRRPKSIPLSDFRALRAATCDELIGRLRMLGDADSPIDLTAHPVTRTLVDEGSPIKDRRYKHREDLIDAVICAWTGLLWLDYGLDRCQVLGIGDRDTPVATIIAPARPAQRRPRLPDDQQPSG
jgi:predicted RNase H-like nuclease